MDRNELDSLMSRLQQGDEEAFGLIYSETKRGLFSFILSICKNYHTSEELMQDTYVRLRTSIDHYKPGSNAPAWLFTIAKNLTLNAINKQKREVFSDFEDSDERYGEYSIDDKIQGPLINIIKKKLDTTEQQIVFLHLISGFKHREIAEMLGKPLGTVLWSYRNALAKIKNEYEKEEGGNEN